jgi:hypothetical protein
MTDHLSEAARLRPTVDRWGRWADRTIHIPIVGRRLAPRLYRRHQQAHLRWADHIRKATR